MTVTCRSFACAALVATALPFTPSPQSTPAGAPAGSPAGASAVTCVVRGGQLFDAERGVVRPLGQLLIAGERIVGEAPLDAPIAAGVRTLDAEGCTVLPGLFDLHAHVMVAGGPMTGGGILPDPELNLATHAAFGVLTASDLHNEPNFAFALRQSAAANPNQARLATAGAAFTVPGGHCTQFGFEANVVKTVADVEARFDALLARKPDVVKAVVEHGGWGTLPTMPTLDEELLAAIATRAKAAGVPLFCHVWTLAEAKQAVRAGVDALVHGVYVGEVDDELIALMKERGTGYVPTLAVVVGARRVAQGRSPYATQRLDGMVGAKLAESLNDPSSASWVADWKEADDALFLRNLKRLHAAGIRCGIGTDAGNPLTPHGPAVLAEIALYVEAGLTPAEALVCATLESARLLRRDRDFGSLAAGKVADLLVVRGDPSREIDALWQVEGVLKAGTPVDRGALRERQQGPERPPRLRLLGRDLEPLVDDFDDGDLATRWGGDWVALSDAAAPGGKSSAELELVEAEGSGALLIRGALAEGSPYGAFAGVTVRWNPIVPDWVDLAGAKALVARVRGTPRTWALSIERAAVVDWDVFAAPLVVTDEWREVRVPLAAFRQSGFGAKVAAGFADVIGLGITARLQPGAKSGYGEFEIEIDSLRIE
ncbi:MAG: CIA30 family protein [Planctomycetes bacterium]|nr:CIA30 family protein [Planctomycetota bacterium]